MTGHDVIIIGGGPAGLSAALVLGRSRRRVLVIDAGEPRNARALAVHGWLTHEGMAPAALAVTARRELAPYDVTLVDDRVFDVEGVDGAFMVKTAMGAFEGRKLLIATGMRDVRPDVPGLDACWGVSAFVCPYCDGWEVRDRRLAAWAPGDRGPDFALGLTTWSDDVVLFATTPVDADQRAALEAAGVGLVTHPIARLRHDDGALVDIEVVDPLGAFERIPRDALFLHFGEQQVSDLGARLGCALAPDGTMCGGRGERSNVPGVFVAGDCSDGLQLVAIACAEGVRAACAINTELRRENLGTRPGMG